MYKKFSQPLQATSVSWGLEASGDIQNFSPPPPHPGVMANNVVIENPYIC